MKYWVVYVHYGYFDSYIAFVVRASSQEEAKEKAIYILKSKNPRDNSFKSVDEVDLYA